MLDYCRFVLLKVLRMSGLPGWLWRFERCLGIGLL
jgi:hypothetical protein